MDKIVTTITAEGDWMNLVKTYQVYLVMMTTAEDQERIGTASKRGIKSSSVTETRTILIRISSMMSLRKVIARATTRKKQAIHRPLIVI